MKKGWFVFLITVGLGSTLFAQESEVRFFVPESKEPKKVFYNFDEVDILGKIKTPTGGSVLQTPEIRFKQLLNLDESFIPKVINAVDEY